MCIGKQATCIYIATCDIIIPRVLTKVQISQEIFKGHILVAKVTAKGYLNYEISEYFNLISLQQCMQTDNKLFAHLARRHCPRSSCKS